MGAADTAAAAIAVAMGMGIAIVWSLDIASARQFDATEGRLRARTPAGELLLPHWVAEYTTSALLIVAAALVVLQSSSASVAMALAAGALGYTSVNSLGWALASADRLPYAIPMVAGIAAAVWLAVYVVVT